MKLISLPLDYDLKDRVKAVVLSQELIFPPRDTGWRYVGLLQVGRCYWWVYPSDAAKHPMMERTASTTKNDLA